MDSLRTIVSQNRRRFENDRYNLDLTYISDHIIAMSFPAGANTLQALFRNRLDTVQRFLDERHKGCYRVYNLCSESSKQYSSDLFDGRTSRYAIPDHAPPQLGQIMPFCQDVQAWLEANPNNVAVIHCKAGKGRTGTMIACYLLYSGLFQSAEKALAHFDQARAVDARGVCIHGQIRYVNYFDALLKERLVYEELDPVVLRSVVFEGLDLCAQTDQLELVILGPLMSGGQMSRYEVSFLCKAARVEERVFVCDLSSQKIVLCGDVRLSVVSKRRLTIKDKRLTLRDRGLDFRTSINTFFLEFTSGEPAAEGDSSDRDNLSPSSAYANLSLPREELDGLHCKDRSKFVVTLQFQAPVA